MEETNERKVISRKQMATKLLDSFFGWGILFGIAVGLVRGAIDIPLTKFLKGNVYDIVTAIIILIGYAIQWMFTARIAVKNTLKKYTINKDQSKGILNKTIVFFSVLNIVVAGLGIYSIIAANNKLAFWGASVDITLPIILQAIVGVGAVGIIIYMANTQKSYIETQCVENMPEEKIKMSVAEIVLLVIIGVILVVTIGWAIKVGVIDRQAMENDEYDYGFLEDDYEENAGEEILDTDTKEENTTNEENKQQEDNIAKYDWSKETKIVSDESGIKYSIENGKLIYYNFEEEKEKVANIKGTPKYIETYLNGGILYIEILTEEGKVYFTVPHEGNSGRFMELEISKYNIKEFGWLEDYSWGRMYYLTKDGKVIDESEREYGIFTSSFGSPITMQLCLKKNSSNIWFYNYDKDDYIVMKDLNGKNVEAKQVFLHEIFGEDDDYVEEFIIITKNNEILHYDYSAGEYDGQKVTSKEKSKVSKIFSKGKDKVEFKLENGSSITVSNLNETYFDVAKLKEIDINTLPKASENTTNKPNNKKEEATNNEETKNEEKIDNSDVEDLYAKQEELVKDAEDVTKKAEIAEAKSLVALTYAKHLYNQEGEEYIKRPVEELEQIINDELLKEFGQGYTVTVSEDYEVTYNFEIE